MHAMGHSHFVPHRSFWVTPGHSTGPLLIVVAMALAGCGDNTPENAPHAETRPVNENNPIGYAPLVAVAGNEGAEAPNFKQLSDTGIDFIHGFHVIQNPACDQRRDVRWWRGDR